MLLTLMTIINDDDADHDEVSYQGAVAPRTARIIQKPRPLQARPVIRAKKYKELEPKWMTMMKDDEDDDNNDDEDTKDD